MLGDCATGGFGLIDEQHVDLGCRDGSRRITEDHFRGFSHRFDGKPQRRKAIALAQLFKREGKRAERMVGRTDLHELQAFLAGRGSDIRHMEKGDSMAASDQLTSQRSKRVKMPGHGRGDDAEVERSACQNGFALRPFRYSATRECGRLALRTFR